MRSAVTRFLSVVGAVLWVGAAEAGPLSPLFLTEYERIEVVQGPTTIDSWNTPPGGLPIAVDGTVRTWGYGAGFAGQEYLLDGTPTGVVYPNTGPSCCFYDGATDGTNNYAVQYSGGDVYSFDADWTNQQFLFASGLSASIGVTYDVSDGTLWLLQYFSSNTVVQHWTLGGALLGTFNTGRNETTAIARDPADDTLWLWSRRTLDGTVDPRLLQYSTSGALLSSQSFSGGPNQFVYGAEFALTSVPEPTSLFLLGSGLVSLGAARRRRPARR